MNEPLFVYRCDGCGNHCVIGFGQSLRCKFCGSMDWTHTASIDPTVIIERLLNGNADEVRSDLTNTKGE